MNKLTKEKRMRVVSALVEGSSINSTARMTGVSKPTILKLLADLGTACAKYQDEKLRSLPCKRVQADEIWSFYFAKDKNLSEEMKAKFGFGSVWTWTAICADTKLIISWLVGERSIPYAVKFIDDLASRLAHRVQMTTDGHKPYLRAVEGAFGSEIDYAVLEKIYAGSPQEGITTRYSPAQYCGTRTHRIAGNPDSEHISTSYAERMNLQIRMDMRRFTRLTNAHSKKVENHRHALALYFTYYNFCRIHSALRVTPAMAAEVSNHVWSIAELVDLLLLAVIHRLSSISPSRTTTFGIDNSSRSLYVGALSNSWFLPGSKKPLDVNQAASGKYHPGGNGAIRAMYDNHHLWGRHCMLYTTGQMLSRKKLRQEDGSAGFNLAGKTDAANNLRRWP